MNICIFDIESLGSDTAYSSIAEFAAILYSDDFKELDRINIRCRIPEGEIPQCTALLVNRLDIKTLTSANYSHYQLINEVQKTFTKWSPCIFIGFSSIHFDEEMLRKEFFKLCCTPFGLENFLLCPFWRAQHEDVLLLCSTPFCQEKVCVQKIGFQ